MKHSLILLCLFIALSIGSSCKKSCGSCQHGGSCSGNVCSCPDPYSGKDCDTLCTLGYEGYNCATLSKTRFFGTWSCTSADPMGNKQTFLITFTDYATQDAYMYMTNFNNKGYVIVCTMSGKYKYDINQQTSTGSIRVAVNGNANLDNGKMTLYINENGEDYFATATRQ